ncbi:glycosyltransferase family 2 protein [Candidatus Pacearchaeota archaeon]|nr:glycosyltransferase family 2 protein [Candidatus Pacearchaeota archaeon]
MGPEVSVIMPSLNEEQAIGECIKKIKLVFGTQNLDGEIIVADNGSTDNSISISKSLGAKVIVETKKGYGNACRAGLRQARGEYVIMGDADDTYDFFEIPRFLKALKENEIVLGSRFKGDIKKGSMPFLHRYIGSPFFRFLFSSLFKLKISEPSTGFVGFRKNTLEKLSLRAEGMEFASEILINISIKKLKFTEIPINYDIRKGKSKLNTLRDGYRHASFILKQYFSYRKVKY